MIEQAQVVAKPAEVLTKKPFVPKKVATRPTGNIGFFVFWPLFWRLCIDI